jgi:hypothetical protein
VNGESAQARPLFAVGDDVYRWEDVVRFARLRGDWAVLADDVRAGLLALEELRARGDEPNEAEVDAAGREFRYERRLLAGDELDAWLERRGLSFGDWRSYLERQIARTRTAGAAPDLPVDDADVEARLWPEGICSGLLDRTASRLARMTATCPGVPLERLDDSFAAFRDRVATDELVRREIELNQIEWLQLVYERADFESEDAALEAALCVRNDGDALSEVAARAGVDLELCTEWLDELPQELVPLFLAARPGGVIGPVRTGEAFRLALLREKRAPLAEDEAVRARAVSAVIERAVERETSERVVWLERF